MAKLLRRSVVALIFTLLACVAVASIGAQQTQQTPPAQTQTAAPPATATPAPAPAPAPTTLSALQLQQNAITAAMRLPDPDAKLAALEKLRTENPQSPLMTTIDSQILTTLTTWPERTTEITAALNRILARIPATATPEVRLSQTVAAVSPLIPKKLMLDRAETLLTAALGALDFEKFATLRKESAKRLNQTEPTKDALETQFNVGRSAGLETLGRVYLAQGADAKAEDALKQSVKANPTGRATTTLVDFYTAKGDTAAAEAILKDIAKAAPTNTAAVLQLARIEEKRGDHASALDRYITAAAGGALRTSADNAAMRALYAKVHGSEKGLDDAIDRTYRTTFPNPVKPEHYKPSDKRSDRLVLLEMFTGSGCGPCVSADLALEAAMERYGSAVITLAYHANIPAPDPMVVPGGDGRREYYKVSGVPTFNIDGALGQPGGGPRVNTPGTYNNYVPKIDKALESPATAALDVRATGEGEQIGVTVNVTKLPADAKDLRLHIVLAERELRFTGENGVRFHPMSVRAVAGERGAGIPISATGTTQWTFNLAAIRDDVTNTLKAEIEKRRGADTPGASTREYMAEGNAYTAIDPSALVVVAFIQQGPYVAPPRGTPVAAPAPAPAGAPTPAASAQAAALQTQAAALQTQAAGTTGTVVQAPPAVTTPAAGQGANATPGAAPAPIVAKPNVLQAAQTAVVFTGLKGKGQ